MARPKKPIEPLITSSEPIIQTPEPIVEILTQNEPAVVATPDHGVALSIIKHDNKYKLITVSYNLDTGLGKVVDIKEYDGKMIAKEAFKIKTVRTQAF